MVIVESLYLEAVIKLFYLQNVGCLYIHNEDDLALDAATASREDGRPATAIPLWAPTGPYPRWCMAIIEYTYIYTYIRGLQLTLLCSGKSRV